MATFTFSLSVTESTHSIEVMGFKGTETISRPFQFDIALRSSNKSIPFSDLVDKTATLTSARTDTGGNQETTKFIGFIADLQQEGETATHAFYHASMVPRIWKLGLTQQSRIFQSESVQQIVTDVLTEHGFAVNTDFAFNLSDTYTTRLQCIQYDETDLNFIRRLMEFEGMRFYFDHSGTVEKMIVTDSGSSYAGSSLTLIGSNLAGSTIQYNPPSGTPPAGDVETISEFLYKEKVVTGSVELKDYDYENAESTLSATSQINNSMPGRYYAYGAKFTDSTEGGRLARVRNREFECQRRNANGKGDCHQFRSGHRFTLSSHYRADLNQEYQLVRVVHTGQVSGGAATYSNEFECIPASVPFSPPRITRVPTLPGIMSATIESATADDEYASIDDMGRYRVRLPFDQRSGNQGTASMPVRLAQPYTGKSYGIHFPMHDGGEMIWGCINGDLDRPIGLSTAPNSSKASPVTSNNNTENVIKTASGHRLVMNDGECEEDVAITLAVGKSGDNYNKSKIEMGGNSAFDFEDPYEWFTWSLGKASEVLSWGSLIGARINAKDPQVQVKLNAAIAAKLAEAAANAAATLVEDATLGDGVSGDTGMSLLGFGTDPVGVEISTDEGITLKGNGGIEIVSPNLLGRWSGVIGAVIPDAPKFVNASLKFIIAQLRQSQLKDKAADAGTLAGIQKSAKTKPTQKLTEALAGSLVEDAEFGFKHILNSAFSAWHDIPGIEIKSAGDTEISALQELSLKGGAGGLSLSSFDNVEISALNSISLTSKRGGLTIRATGVKAESFDQRGWGIGWLREAFSSLGDKVGKSFKTKFGIDENSKIFKFWDNWYSGGEDPPDLDAGGGTKDREPILLWNDNGDIISLAAKGNILLNALEGELLLSSKNDTKMEAKQWKATKDMGFTKTYLENNQNMMHISSSGITLNAKDNINIGAGNKFAITTAEKGYLKLTKDEKMEAKFGDKVNLILEKNGSKITIEGKDGTITINGKGGKVNIDADDITLKAKNAIAIEGKKVTLNGNNNKLLLQGTAANLLASAKMNLRAKQDITVDPKMNLNLNGLNIKQQAKAQEKVSAKISQLERKIQTLKLDISDANYKIRKMQSQLNKVGGTMHMIGG